MKQYFGAILRFFKAVFFTFGLLIFLFCVRRYLPGFNGSQGVGLVELRLCLAMAVVFSMAHTIITSDRVPIITSYRENKGKLLYATGILSSITCGVLSVYSGIPSAIIRWFDITDTTVAILSWWAGFFICFVVLLFIYFVVERYYRHLEYHYNEALAKYKESSGKTK